MDLPNRYDLMIRMDLSKKALEEFDNGEIHKEWKKKFGKYIMNKTIFDCEYIIRKGLKGDVLK